MDAGIAAASGAAVGVAGIFFGWLNSRGERKHTLTLAREQHEHERRLARGERLFDARTSAYEELLRHLRLVQLLDRRGFDPAGEVLVRWSSRL